jgi:hypothetical protein
MMTMMMMMILLLLLTPVCSHGAGIVCRFNQPPTARTPPPLSLYSVIGTADISQTRELRTYMDMCFRIYCVCVCDDDLCVCVCVCVCAHCVAPPRVYRHPPSFVLGHRFFTGASCVRAGRQYLAPHLQRWTPLETAGEHQLRFTMQYAGVCVCVRVRVCAMMRNACACVCVYVCARWSSILGATCRRLMDASGAGAPTLPSMRYCRGAMCVCGSVVWGV